MAIQQARPLVRTSTLRKLRAQRFGTKTPVGPETTRAVISADLDVERKAAADAAALAARQKAEADRLSEQKRQFDIQAQARRRERKDKEKNFFDGILGT